MPEVRGDKAYLSGIVKDPVEKQLAEEIALGVDGIEKSGKCNHRWTKVKLQRKVLSSVARKSAISDAMITAQIISSVRTEMCLL